MVEPQSLSDREYEVVYQTEPPNARCQDAPALNATVTGSTAGGRSAFFDSRVCGSNAGPDRVYRLSVDRRVRTVLDLVASYTRPALRVLTSCSGVALGGPRFETRFDQILEPGDYIVVVDGETSTDAGDFVLSLVQTSP